MNGNICHIRYIYQRQLWRYNKLFQSNQSKLSCLLFAQNPHQLTLALEQGR